MLDGSILDADLPNRKLSQFSTLLGTDSNKSAFQAFNRS